MQDLTRRKSLTFAAALGAAALAPRVVFAAAKAEVDDVIQKFTGGRQPGQGAVTLDLPEIAENGNSVPLTVKVASPMTDQSYVSQIIIVAEANPTPTAATFTLTPMSGKAEVSARIRLAQTQTVTAIAKMNDGSIQMDKKTIKVTAGGCGG
ncbi:thiosulfate oxidation carrier protein SoxY [Rhodoblastus sp.]|uniref:thiosulfate oxidation carrier protein SoxY n=1 Tax=Rhodoblastus sp. TaxID=1962975 RepID=UPI00261D9A4A|nr:thiosulfate oxidation carrier protein SoxY [Rhodoblastus sp.]